MTVKLSELKEGESGSIVDVRLTGHFRKRILEMGFVPGQDVLVVRNAPLQDPIEYKVMNYEVSLRRKEAQHIYVNKSLSKEHSTNASAPVVKHDPNIHPDILGNGTKKEIPADTKISVAFLGNPNCGKTSLFNACCGTHEHVGNYSGVTVDAKHGKYKTGDINFDIIDLPGTYSLSSYSPEEKYIEDFLAGDKRPDVIVNVISATNLERHLYLTTQLLETGIPMVIALNMFDEFEASGSKLNIPLLSQLLGTPVVPTVARKGEGKEELFNCVHMVYAGSCTLQRKVPMPYSLEIVKHRDELAEFIRQATADQPHLSWCHGAEEYIAIKLLEGDPLYTGKVEKEIPKGAFLLTKARYISKTYSESYSRHLSDVITDTRYGFINGALRETLDSKVDHLKGRDQKIDYWLTHRIWGFPIFLLFMYLMFQTTFTLGEYPMEWIEAGVAWLGEAVRSILPGGALQDLICDGIIGGVGGVIVFLPNIMILYVFISFMEDTGYMARAAFIMDKLMHSMGIHGKSFIPLIMGFGCNVPAIMATRTIESKNSRLITMLILPFMSCSARLPVYILLTGAFFSAYAGTVVFSIYIIGILLALLTAFFLRKFFIKEEDVPFVMELPPYRLPTTQSILLHMWDKAKQYLTKMGTTILLASIVIWCLSYFPRGNEADIATGIEQMKAENNTLQDLSDDQLASMYQQENSYIGKMGKALQPIFSPMDYDWKLTMALLSGLPAKEVVVSTMGVLYTGDMENEAGLQDRLSQATLSDGSPAYTPVMMFSFMLFVLVYFPCIATIVAIGRESGSAKWALFSMIYSCSLAWLVAFTATLVGKLFT